MFVLSSILKTVPIEVNDASLKNDIDMVFAKIPSISSFNSTSANHRILATEKYGSTIYILLNEAVMVIIIILRLFSENIANYFRYVGFIK